MDQQFQMPGTTAPRKKVSLHIEPLPFQAREAINVLRGNIQLSGADLKVIAVTSASPNEGKSATAFRLANSFASLEKKTLFVDCDIRNSVTAERYGIQEKLVGLTEYLCGTFRIPDVVYETEDAYLDLLFTGAVAPNPSELISSLRFQQLFKWSRAKYEYVIVDTPPINAVIDGALIAKQCDGAVLVIESCRTDRTQAVRAKKQLEYSGVKILGAVMNKTGSKKNGYSYGYGYGYGYVEKPEDNTAKYRKLDNE